MTSRKKQKQQTATDFRLQSSWERMKDSSRRYGQIDALTAETFLSFIYTYNQFSSYLDKIARAYGITRAGINVLTVLRSHKEEGCNQQLLCRLLLVSRANVTGLVDGLIRKKLVERLPDANDRRACIVKISLAGERLLEAFLPLYHQRIAQIFSGLKNTEKKFFNSVMKKFRASIEKQEP